MSEEIVEIDENQEEDDENKRKWLLIILAFLLLLLCMCSGLFYRYVSDPEPLPAMLLPQSINYPPHYLFSIYVDQPVGVAMSPEEDRLYVAESGGDRLVRVMTNNGVELSTIAPPRTGPGERSPVYLATDENGRVFVIDRLQHAIFVYGKDGDYMDTIIHPDLTLSEYVSQHLGRETPFYEYNLFDEAVFYQTDEGEQTLPPPQVSTGWSPLGVYIDNDNLLYVTDVAQEKHQVRQFTLPDTAQLTSWHDVNPTEISFGEYGQGSGELLYPNKAVKDSTGRMYVSDGNNGRISVWDGDGNFLYNFAGGATDGSVSLPRGIFIDDNDRLFVPDAVGQDVKVYDVSNSEPEFLYTFGDFGMDDGLFNYPNDIVVTQNGYLYIADRENNRIQVWSY